MSYLDRIATCNNYNPAHFLSLLADGVQVGEVKHGFVRHLEAWPDVFQVTSEGICLSPDLHSFEERTRQIGKIIRELIEQKVIHRWHGEQYPVSPGSRDNALFLVDRASVSYFGIRAFGQHMNGYVRDGETIKMWLARRALNKWNEPGKLDNMVAGGLPYAISLEENLGKECWEEAAIPAELAARARKVGFISYRAETPTGLKPDTMFCYDLEVPAEFVPACNDGEVAEFDLLPIDEVAEIVCRTEDIKKNSNLVIIDFLLRQGFIPSNHPDYPRLREGLKQ